MTLHSCPPPSRAPSMKHISLDNINRVVASSSGEVTPKEGSSPRMGVIDAFPLEPAEGSNAAMQWPHSPSKTFARGSVSPAATTPTTGATRGSVTLPLLPTPQGASPTGAAAARVGASNGARGGLRSPAAGVAAGSTRLSSPPSRLGSRAAAGRS